MTHPATVPHSPSQSQSRSRRWPLTTEAWRSLSAELERLADDVARAASPAVDGDGLVRLSVAQAERRLASLRAVADAADVHDRPGVAVIGRRVTLREDDGEVVTYSIVFPGDGDPQRGWISADSPLGGALLHGRAGARVEVVAPAGRRTVALVAVE